MDQLPKFEKLRQDMNDIKHMKIMSVTWNMGAVEPNCEQLDNLLQKDLADHDMYLIAS